MPMTVKLLTLYFVAAANGAPDNRGTEFIVAFLQNVASGGSFDLDLFITTYVNSSVNAHVTIPKNLPSYNESLTITSGNVQKVVIPNGLRASGTAKEDKGILITASDEVVVMGLNRESNSNDGFLGLPTDILGTEYYVVTYSPPYVKCQFLIAGVEDGTVVNITVGPNAADGTISYGGSDYGVGESFTVTLDRFDTFQAQLNKDLTGSFISSSKPVAVFSGNIKTNIGAGSSQDHIVEQLPPVKTWGKQFATVSIPERIYGDEFLFLASENNTNVTVTGNSVSETFILENKGDSRKIVIDSGPDYYTKVVADKPILTIHFVVSKVKTSDKGDPAMILLTPVEQYESRVTFSTPERPSSPYNHYFVFVTKDADKDGLRIDGGAFPGGTVYNPIPGSDLVGGYISISEGIHTVENSNPLARFGGYIFGEKNKESYALPTGMRLSPINQECVETAVGEADGLDNDCDGRIDEELCTGANRGVDDDGDGEVDEDCAVGVPSAVPRTTASPSPTPSTAPGPVPSPAASPGPVGPNPTPSSAPGPVPSPTASPGPLRASPTPSSAPGPVSSPTASSGPVRPSPTPSSAPVPVPSPTASPGPVRPSPTPSSGKCTLEYALKRNIARKNL